MWDFQRTSLPIHETPYNAYHPRNRTAVAFAVFWLVTTSSAEAETHDYTVVSKGQKFEIRDYPN